MDEASLFLITDVPGLTPQIGRLVSMMNYARWTTLQTVEGLTLTQLDYLHDERSNSIGALLRHIAAVEVAYQTHTFEQRGMTEDEGGEWGAALELGERGRLEIRGFTLHEYEQCLSDVRDRTLEELSKRDDDWLNEESPLLWSGFGERRSNNWFKWFHVFEDEINHRGQMRWLRKRLPGSA